MPSSSLNLDQTVQANKFSLFGDTSAYTSTFPNGIAGAYKDYMTKNILPQIKLAPKYLTAIW